MLAVQELVDKLEKGGFEGLEPFGNFKGDMVVLAIQGPNALLADGKIVLNTEPKVSVPSHFGKL